MKSPLLTLITATILLTGGQIASATTLFTDNFTVDGPSGFPATPTTGANFELNFPGRQGGTLATPTLGYINGFVRDGNEQLGNTTDFTTAPGSGFNLLMANLGSVRINYDFSTINAAVTFNFDGNVKSPDTTDWLSFMVGPVNQNQFITDSTAGILFRANGGTQIFNTGTGTTGGSGTAPGSNVWQNYQVVLSDTAGTGSAFAGNGSKMTYYANGIMLGSATLGQLTSGQGYIAFGASNQLAGVANLAVTTTAVPEPSTYAVGMVALLGGLIYMRRRRLA